MATRTSRRNFVKGAAAIAGSQLIFASCGGGDDDSGTQTNNTTPSSSTTATAKKPQGTLRVAHASFGEEVLDPHRPSSGANGVIFYPLYDQLANYDADGKLTPELAESWEQAGSGLEWTFKIRTGINTHDGKPITAEVVSWNLDRQKALGGSGAFADFYDHSTVIDDKTLKVFTKQPLAIAPDVIGTTYIVSRAAVESGGDDVLKSQPVGSGAFTFKSRTVGQDIVYQAYADYWRGAPGVETLRFGIVPELTTRVAQLKTGETDIAVALAGPSIDDVEGTSSLKTKKVEDASFLVMCPFDLYRPESPLHDTRVMQAANYAIDKDAIIKGIFRGRAKSAPYGYMGPTTLGFVPNQSEYKYDPAKAKSLLSEAGYQNGIDLPQMYSIQLSQYAQSTAVLEAINNYFRAVGIRCPLATLDYGTYVANERDAKLRPNGLNLLSSAYVPEMHTRLNIWTRTGALYSPYNHPEYDKLLDAEAIEFDKAKRVGILQQISKALHDTPKYVFTVNPDAYFGMNKKVSDWNQPKASVYIDNLDGVRLS